MPQYRSRIEVRFTKAEWDEAQNKVKQVLLDEALDYLDTVQGNTLSTGPDSISIDNVMVGTHADAPGAGFVLISEPWPETANSNS